MVLRPFRMNARSPEYALALNTDRKYRNHPAKRNSESQSSAAGLALVRSHDSAAHPHRAEAISNVAARTRGKRKPAGEMPPAGRNKARQRRGSCRLYRIDVLDRSAVPGRCRNARLIWKG